MIFELIRTAPRLDVRGRAFALWAVVALASSGCASERTVATVPAGGGMPPVMAAANDPPKAKVASAPLGYPWATGASLPTASAGAPTVTR